MNVRRFAPVAGALVAALAVSGTASAQSATAPKVAVIDVRKVVTDSAMGKESFAKLKKLQETKLEEGKKREKDLRDLEQQIADKKFSIAEDKLAQMQKDYQNKAIEFKRFQDDANRELETAERGELAEMERKIMPVISAIGREEKFTLMFNKFEAGLVYADEAVDITDTVIKRFNAAVTAAADAKAGQPASPKPADPGKKK